MKTFLNQFHRSNQKSATIKKTILIIFKNFQKKIFRKYFPDWPERVEYQNRQLEFLQSSKKKLREADRLRLNEDFKSKILTQDEKDALAYFSGAGFYKYYQDLNTPPNLYDTRQTFLDKMQNSEMRKNFLKACN